VSLLAHLLSPRASSGSDSISAEAWTPGAGFQRQTRSGETVSHSRAMTYSTWFACIRNIAEDIGKLPLELFEVLDNGGKNKARSHPLYRLLKLAPNDEMAASVLWELVTGWGVGWGNGYLEIERDAAGNPVSLWPIHPSRCSLHRVDGRIVLDVWSSNDMGNYGVARLDYADVFHLRGFGDDPLCGLSVARLAAESIGFALAAQTYGATFFANGATPSMLLIHPGKLSSEGQTNLRESWKKRLTGNNKGGVAVLQEGIKAERMSIPPEEAQFLETRQFQVAEIARWFRMPPHMVQDLSRSTNNNIEHQGIEYTTQALSPWMNRIQQECERKLLNSRDWDRYDVKFNDKALMRGDSKARADYYRTMISTGVMTPNEARAAEDLNPDASKGADRLYIQGAMMTLDQVADQADKPERTQQIEPKPEPDPDPAKEQGASYVFNRDPSGNLLSVDRVRK